MVTYPASPELIDAVTVEFNSAIANKLSWLNNRFGNIQSLSKSIHGMLVKVPAIHIDNREYIELFPSDKLVNYSWWHFDPIEQKGKRISSKLKAKARFNVYVNLDLIYPGVASRNIENLKSTVYQAVSELTLLNGSIRIHSISDDYNLAYKGFNLSSIEDKYFMQPYAVLSFQCNVFIRNFVCNALPCIRYTDVLNNNQVLTNDTKVMAYGI